MSPMLTLTKPGQERCDIETMHPGDLVDHLERYRFASPHVQGRRVLDIACGTGYGAQMYVEAGATDVIGVDVSPEAITAARQRCPQGTFLHDSMVTFRDAPFDVITSFETIEHVEDYQGALLNLRRLLKPGGTLILSTPNRPVNDLNCHSLTDKPANPWHVREFTTAEMRHALIDAGFTDIQTYGQKFRRMLTGPTFYLYGAIVKLGLLKGHYNAAVLPASPGLESRYSVFVCH